MRWHCTVDRFSAAVAANLRSSVCEPCYAQHLLQFSTKDFFGEKSTLHLPSQSREEDYYDVYIRVRKVGKSEVSFSF